MASLLRKTSVKKDTLHPRNRHKERYDFEQLAEVVPSLSAFVVKNKYGEKSIDFSNPKAVKTLNKALLKYFYGISWDIPEGYLCPPIPGRADYIHYVADLLSLNKDKSIRILDIGTGSNCIYPIIGYREYGWSFLGSDIDPVALESARKIVELNNLSHVIKLKLQPDPLVIFKGILEGNEVVDACICNPPFHSSLEEAAQGTKRKWKNLKGIKACTLNFGGRANELSCEGGEFGFVKRMILESALVKDRCTWFTILISRAENLSAIYQELKEVKAAHVKTINMAQGQKKSRIVAWSFI